MADRPRPHQLHVHPQYGAGKGFQPRGEQQGPSAGKIVAVLTLLPVGATLLFLAGLTFIGTLIWLAISTPVFLLFSPILVPAAITIGLANAGFLTSGAFGVTGLSSLSWVLNNFKRTLDQKAKEVGHKAQEGKRT